MNPLWAAFWASLGSLVYAACLVRADRKRGAPDQEQETFNAGDKPCCQCEQKEQRKERLRAARRRYFIDVVLRIFIRAAIAAGMADSGEIKYSVLAIGVGFAPAIVERMLTKGMFLELLSWLQLRLGDAYTGVDRSGQKPASVVGAESDEADRSGHKPPSVVGAESETEQ